MIRLRLPISPVRANRALPENVVSIHHRRSSLGGPLTRLLVVALVVAVGLSLATLESVSQSDAVVMPVRTNSQGVTAPLDIPDDATKLAPPLAAIEVGTESAAPEVIELNSRVAERLRGFESVTLVDLMRGFDPAVLTNDGIHPTVEGSGWMAERWLGSLDAAGLAEPGADLTLLPLGDSITAGAYRYELWASLVESGVRTQVLGDRSTPPIVPTPPLGGVEFDGDHAGYDGATIEEIEGLMPQVDESPDAILLHVGTNDLFWTSDTPDAVAERLVGLVEALIEEYPGAEVFVARIIPYHPDARAFLRSMAETEA